MSTKKVVSVITGTRAEYGLLRPLIKRIIKDPDIAMRLIVTGAHLSAAFGETLCEIEQDGYPVQAKIPIPLASDTHVGMACATGSAITAFADYFDKNRPDMLVVLGDRYEIFAAAVAAAMLRIPIAHIGGGDTSEGAMDEFMRHSITKMSCLHFTTNEQSMGRVIQMGENPSRVFNVGALNIENIMSLPLLSRKELSDILTIDPSCDYALVTYHPVTMNEDDVSEFIALLKAIDAYQDMRFVFTKANADAGGRTINAMLDDFAAGKPNCVVFSSLGTLRYLSAMKYAAVVIGNSSSGLYETPSFGVPCVNIGDRQRGRLKAVNVIDCPAEADAIVAAVERALSTCFQKTTKIAVSSFGKGDTSQRIMQTLKKVMFSHDIDLKKNFYNI